MAKKSTMTSQLNNIAVFQSIFRQMLSLAKNVYPFDGFPDTVDLTYLNDNLLYKGSVAVFADDILGLVALPYRTIGRLSIYNKPIQIQCFSRNGYQSDILTPDRYVIIYDNTEYCSIVPDIRLYAQRMALTTRTGDINISQQRTPRIIKGSKSQEITIKNLYDTIDRNEDIIYTYKDLDIDDIQTVLAPAPYVADKLDDHIDKIWNEFCRFIGISSIAQTKKERLITDEVNALQAGAVASRWSRYLPRAVAVKEINKKFPDYLESELSIKYYDTEPESIDNDGSILIDEDEGGDNLVL